MSAPTAAEIRAIVDRISRAYPMDNEERALKEAVEHLFTAIDFQRVDWALPGEEPEPDELGNHLWTGLGLVAEAALAVHVAAAKNRALKRARAAIVEEVVAAAIAFAAEYPDAPRQRREVPA